MFDVEKSHVSMVLAVVAVVVSTITLYLVHLRGLELTLNVADVIHISNTRGGKPDIHLNLELSAQGASTNYLSVREIQGGLHTIADGKCIESVNMVGVPQGGITLLSGSGLPAVINGGEKRHIHQLLFVDEVHRRSPSARMMEDEKWCRALKSAVSEGVKTKADRICSALAELDAEAHHREACRNDDNKCDGVFDIDEAIAEVLDSLKHTKREFLYFRQGEYRLEVSVMLEDGHIGHTEIFKFWISDDDSDVLLDNYNKNLPLRMEKTSAQCEETSEMK